MWTIFLDTLNSKSNQALNYYYLFRAIHLHEFTHSEYGLLCYVCMKYRVKLYFLTVNGSFIYFIIAVYQCVTYSILSCYIFQKCSC